MSDDDFVTVEGVAATTHQIETRYGPFRMTPDELLRLADAMTTGEGHFNAQHDPESLWEATDVEAWVEEVDDYHYLKYRARVPREQHDAFLARVRAEGAPGGFSVTRTEPVVQVSDGASLGVIGDAADFSDEELLGLAALLGDRVHVSRLYQLAAKHDVVRFILVVVVSGAMWDFIKGGAKVLMGRLLEKARSTGRPVAIDVQLHLPEGGTELKRVGVVRQDGDLRAALDALQRICER